MGLNSDFSSFCKLIELDTSEMMKTVAEIAKKLNKEYYDLDGDNESHMYIVGSVGRKTAIKGASDLDLLFALPKAVYDQFNAYKNNGQSALLQEIKECLQERYKRTALRGDGQVVVIEFTQYTVELVPAFIKRDNSFLYPDTHDGGSWKTTNPLPEQTACELSNNHSSGLYYDLCHLIRAWKNEIGFEFSGLLIDTLIDNHLQDEDYYTASDYSFLSALINCFDYLRGCDPKQNYWTAIGSGQHVSDKGNGAFVNKAEKAFKLLKNSISDGTTKEALVRLLGKNFPHEKTNEGSSFRNTEEFIESKYPVDIRYGLTIDCTITQDGFRPFRLRDLLARGIWLRHNKQLDFYIDSTNCPKPYEICWKVRNVGKVAEQKDQIRGQIKNTGKRTHREHTSFYGPHYVECYLIKGGVCVARSRIDVPIDRI